MWALPHSLSGQLAWGSEPRLHSRAALTSCCLASSALGRTEGLGQAGCWPREGRGGPQTVRTWRPWGPGVPRSTKTIPSSSVFAPHPRLLAAWEGVRSEPRQQHLSPQYPEGPTAGG